MTDTSKPRLVAGFKEFVIRGNVIDPAVAIVIGAAFTDVVNSVINGASNPLVGAFGMRDLAGYSSCLKSRCTVNDKGELVAGVRIQRGSVVSASPTFPVTAAVVYFPMVLPMSRYLARQAAERKPAEVKEKAAEVEEITLRRDICDAPVAPRAGTGNHSVASSGRRSRRRQTGRNVLIGIRHGFRGGGAASR